MDGQQELVWRSAGGLGGVEVASDDRWVYLRSSWDRGGPGLAFTHQVWREFLATVRSEVPAFRL